MHASRLIAVLMLISAMGTALFAQDAAQTANPVKTGVFFFDSGDDMFYLEKGRNRSEMASVIETLKANMEDLKAGKVYIAVKSYIPMDRPGAAKIAGTRAKRVKSALVMEAGANEDMFRTKVLDGTDSNFIDVVVLNLPVTPETEIGDAPVEVNLTPVEKVEENCEETEPAPVADEAEIQKIKEEADALVAQACKEAGQAKAEAERVKAEAALQVAEAREEAEIYKLQVAEYEAMAAKENRFAENHYNLALRSNLLRWATLTPDLGLEWRICPSVGIGFNATYTHWSWDKWNKHYDIWEIRPEVRWYLGQDKNFYVGAMFHTGEYNYKISWLGYKGKLIGGGALIGYQLRMTDALSMDFGLGLGASHATYDKYWYNRPERKNVYEGRNIVENVWGVTHLGVTLVWKMF